MYIEFHDRLGNAQRVQVTRVVAYDDFGNPYALAISYDQHGQSESIIAASLGCDDFQGILQNMGIRKTVIIRDLEQRPLSGIQF